MYPEHGGNIYYYGRLFALPPTAIIDMSSSVNPLAKEFLAEKLTSLLHYLEFYPDPEAGEIKELLAERYKLPLEGLLIGNGSMELISLTLWHLLAKGSQVLLLEPTFGGYKKYLAQRRDLKIESNVSLHWKDWLESIDAFLERRARKKTILLCNPNNPTGWLIPKASLLERMERSPETLFIVDEAFIDFVEEESLVSKAPHLPNLIVLRSLTKFYGLAGSRLGYLVASPHLVEHLKTYVPTWNVNTLSQIFAKILLTNEDFRQRSLEFFYGEKALFEDIFKRLNIFYFPSVTNFYLFKLEGGREFFSWLLKKKRILIRLCENFKGLSSDYLRVSLKDHGANKLFLEGLREWLEEQ